MDDLSDTDKKGSGARMKPSGVGGMAVMEGVMMKNKDEYAVAVRKPDNEIVVEKSTHKDFSDKAKLFKLPIFRGMMAFVDSMVIGIKVLNFSASFFEEEEDQTKTEKGKKTDKKNKSKQGKTKNATKQDDEFAIEELSVADSHRKEVIKSDKDDAKKGINQEQSNALLMAAAVFVSLIISVGLFMVLPVFVSGLFRTFVNNDFIVNLLEGILRISIFIAYVLFASLMPEIKRVFMYHGAEHKTINCLESGFELTVENVRWQSKEHKRCGTSFMLLVMLISLIIFMIIPPLDLVYRVLSRVLLVPFIAGISYEFIRLAGKNESKIVNILSKPGMLMQGLTTKEPDDQMIEVAIASVGAVFDWRAFLETETSKDAAVGTKNNTGRKAAVNTEEKKTAKSSQGGAKVKEVQGSRAQNVKKDETVSVKPVKKNTSEEEDDEILKALDKYLDFKDNAEANAGENA
ncbi:MAG: hypothetical protein K0S76_913 [Herbinix sp.]|nr:hypothetical protein [Herbinix sp.]